MWWWPPKRSGWASTSLISLLIVHLEMPASIEEYMQETGRLARGARDGEGPETGTAVLLVKPRDCKIHDYFMRSSIPDLTTMKNAWSNLDIGMNFINPAQFASQLAAETSMDHDIGDDDRQQAVALALHYLQHVKAVRRHQDFVLRGRITTVEATEQRMEALPQRYPQLAAPASAMPEVNCIAPWNPQRYPQLAAPASRIMELVEQEDGDYDGLRWRTLLGMAPSEVEAVLYELQRLDICGFSSWKYGWLFERTTENEPDWNRLRNLIGERRREIQRRSEQARAFRPWTLTDKGEPSQSIRPWYATPQGCIACPLPQARDAEIHGRTRPTGRRPVGLRGMRCLHSRAAQTVARLRSQPRGRSRRSTRGCSHDRSRAHRRGGRRSVVETQPRTNAAGGFRWQVPAPQDAEIA